MSNEIKMNKVLKGGKYYYNIGVYTAEKYTWICAECGLEWFSREEARRCASRGHVSSYRNYYGIQKAFGRIDLKKNKQKGE